MFCLAVSSVQKHVNSSWKKATLVDEVSIASTALSARFCGNGSVIVDCALMLHLKKNLTNFELVNAQGSTAALLFWAVLQAESGL